MTSAAHRRNSLNITPPRVPPAVISPTATADISMSLPHSSVRLSGAGGDGGLDSLRRQPDALAAGSPGRAGSASSSRRNGGRGTRSPADGASGPERLLPHVRACRSAHRDRETCAMTAPRTGHPWGGFGGEPGALLPAALRRAPGWAAGREARAGALRAVRRGYVGSRLTRWSGNDSGSATPAWC